MNSPQPMTRQELLEHAALDALGLLDEFEAALYTRSFHYAPATVQDEVLRLQAEIAGDESLLTAAGPDSALRERVLQAVADAIEREAAQLAPLATIGRALPLAGDVERRAVTAPFWRAAALALSAALIVVSYFLVDTSREASQIANLALSNLTSAQLEEMLGPTLKSYLFDPAARQVHFAARARAANMHAKLFVNEGAAEGFLVVENLPRSESAIYVLTAIDETGIPHEVQRFATTGRVSGTALKLPEAVARLRNPTWEISDASGVLLASI